MGLFGPRSGSQAGIASVEGEAAEIEPGEVDHPDVNPLAASGPPGRHSAEHFDSWVGAFVPYAVGDPGRAATEVVPVPDPQAWHRRDSVFDGFVVGRPDGTPVAELRAASLRGLSHRSFGRTRQDEYAYQVTPDGRYLVLCVADGVSSGPRSHHAAEVAARTGVTLLVNALEDAAPEALDWDRLVGAVAGHIVTFARKRLPGGEQMDVSEIVGWMATTATYAVVDLANEEMEVFSASVGDSSAWVLSERGWEPVAQVKNDGAAVDSSSVGALPMVPSRPMPSQHTRVRAGEALVLMSDGVGDPLRTGEGEVGRFLAQAWRRPPHDLDFAAQVGFHRRSFDDDRTVIAVWPLRR
ncbi:Serine/threonine protein phosphatase PrpC [Lentzea waywayandensis]|uniref:Serine/threonine protein phosphatase PrpC n=1 Tax=Lentzea waywayandensis TaxID=84724 RepID=A0A1I6EZ17_9PSEU|nr:protein phosphatase 2C domain-containing protein [Lentzea waywayandensis]SFR22914.1 Serine/threonine protein phosphatase PrpC [Lentzea waywayandensis]